MNVSRVPFGIEHYHLCLAAEDHLKLRLQSLYSIKKISLFRYNSVRGYLANTGQMEFTVDLTSQVKFITGQIPRERSLKIYNGQYIEVLTTKKADHILEMSGLGVFYLSLKSG